MKKVSLLNIKEALLDSRFREKLPPEYTPEVSQFLTNTGCACNVPLYKKILKNHKSLLQEFFPGAEIEDESKEVEKLSKNNWRVINCHYKDLESELKKLPAGRKQLQVARYQDQVTVVINELDFVW